MTTKATGDDPFSKIDQENQEIEQIHATLQSDLTSLLQSEHVGSIGPQLIQDQTAVQQEWFAAELDISVEKAEPYSLEPKPLETYTNEWTALDIDWADEDRFKKIEAKKDDPAASALIEKAADEKDLSTVSRLLEAGVKPPIGKDPQIYLAALAHVFGAMLRNI